MLPCCRNVLCCFQSFSKGNIHLTVHGHGHGSSSHLSVSGQRARVLEFCVLEGERDGQWVMQSAQDSWVWSWSDGQMKLGIMARGVNGWAVSLAAWLLVRQCVHGHPVLITDGFGPELLL